MQALLEEVLDLVVRGDRRLSRIALIMSGHRIGLVSLHRGFGAASSVRSDATHANSDTTVVQEKQSKRGMSRGRCGA